MNDWMEIVRTLVDVLLGGGLLVSLLTLKSTRRKARAEAAQADMDLAKNYVGEFSANVVDPLKKEVKGLRRDVKTLRNAVEKANSCVHADGCPVRVELQKQRDADQDGGA